MNELTPSQVIDEVSALHISCWLRVIDQSPDWITGDYREYVEGIKKEQECGASLALLTTHA